MNGTAASGKSILHTLHTHTLPIFVVLSLDRKTRKPNAMRKEDFILL